MASVSYRFTKSQERETEDVEKLLGMNDKYDQLLMDRKKVTNTSTQQNIPKEEFDHSPIPSTQFIYGPIQLIIEETVTALMRMEANKATPPND
ncbi:hypothetical protein Y032_0002g1008 [Ancylostoma ceylanicum]|uniref:Uncharacterized protein n=1 Tax=Ancylostoma ceylanicum TaxID=53326 RepID=A0A016VZ91_9BILA|nr:hypothetical protein Y032_0002g1008 [Ancylostoma ceylanicum]